MKFLMKLSCSSILFSSFLLFFFSSDISASLVISVTSRVNVSDVIVALNGGQGEPFRDRSPAFPEMGKTGADGMRIGGGREMVYRWY